MGNQQLSLSTKECKHCRSFFKPSTSKCYCDVCNKLRVKKKIERHIYQQPDRKNFVIYYVNIRRNKKLQTIIKTPNLEEARKVRDEYLKNSPADWSKPHLIKHNIAYFHKVKPIIKAERRFCNRCNKDLINADRYNWVLHHIDHNRENNQLDNFELLCKKCHQDEHIKRDSLGRFESSETIENL